MKIKSLSISLLASLIIFSSCNDSNADAGDGVLIAACIHGKCGCINEKGQWIIPPKFDNVWTSYDHDEELIGVALDGKCGYVDKSGRMIITPQFDYVEPFSDTGVAIAEKDEKYGFIDKTGRWILEPQFDWVIDDHSAIE